MPNFHFFFTPITHELNFLQEITLKMKSPEHNFFSKYNYLLMIIQSASKTITSIRTHIWYTQKTNKITFIHIVQAIDIFKGLNVTILVFYNCTCSLTINYFLISLPESLYTCKRRKCVNVYI